MQRRERMLLLATGLVVGGWLVDSMLIGPGLTWMGRLRAESAAARQTAQESQALVDRQARIMGDWRARHAAGLLEDEDAVRYRVQQALAASAKTSSCAIDSVSGSQRVPASQGQAYDLLRMTVTGQGSLAEIQAFLAGIETAAVALRIERCELAARDGRRDQLDLSLTLSTRLVSTSARGGRSLPAGTAAWQAAERDRSLDASTLAARPFLVDRRSTAKVKSRESDKVAAPVVAAPAGGWTLVGIVSSPTGAEAFLRHLGKGTERLVHVGDTISVTTGDTAGEEGRVVAIDADGLRFMNGDQERRIAVGSDLHGVSATFTGAAAAVGGSPPASTAGSSPPRPASSAASVPSPFQVPASSANPDAESVLQRLRQQRNRASGATP